MKKLLLLALIVAATGAAEERYETPIVFQRAEIDPATGKTKLEGKLWIMDGDGSKLRQITHGKTYDEHASMNSDGEHVLYSEFEVGYLDHHQGGVLVKLNIYSGRRIIIDHEEGCALHHASLSPVDDLVAYHYNCGERFRQALDLGENRWETQTQATNGVRTSDGIIAMHEPNPGYSPREVSLVHIRGRGADETAEHLTDDKVLHRRPAINPDETLLAWQTNAPSGGEDEIYVADIDGSNARNLTKAKGNDGHPWFSRDGEWLVFESDRSGDWEIWRINLDGTGLKQLTDGKGKYQSTRARM